MEEKILKKLLAEQSHKIDAKLDKQNSKIDAKLAEQNNKIDLKLAEQTEELERHQKMLSEEFQSHLKVVAEVQVEQTKKLDAIIEMTALNTENIETMKGMLKRKVDFEEYEKLEKRVLVLEKKLRMSGT